MSDIGKIIWSRGHKERGVVTNESETEIGFLMKKRRNNYEKYKCN